MRFHDPEVDRILAAADENRVRLADALAVRGENYDPEASRYERDRSTAELSSWDRLEQKIASALIELGPEALSPAAQQEVEQLMAKMPVPGSDEWFDTLPARAADIHFSHEDMAHIEAVVVKLAGDPALDGYQIGYPTWGLFSGHDIDINIAATSTCPTCDRYGRGHVGFVAADGSHSWRGFAICPGCGTAEEF